MQILSHKAYFGPNRWSRFPSMEVVVELAGGATSNGKTIQELSEVIGQLHALSGVACQVFPVVQLTDSTYQLSFEFEEPTLLQECIRLGLEIWNSIPFGEPIDLAPYHRRLVDLADDVRLGPSSRAILRAAAARGIPFFRLNQGSLVQFGEGVFQRRTWTAETDATSAIAESIASDKQLTRSLLAAVGVNVPAGRLVTSREDAWQAAIEVGVPVVVKPRNANHAVGVSLDLSDPQAVMEAYNWACQAGHTTDVLVEQYIEGDHHRLLVVGGRFVAAARGQREYVVGDGTSTIGQLVDQLNSDPRRGENYTDQLQVVKLDDAAVIELRKQELTVDSVPEKDRQVLVCHVGDLIEDCTDKVHPTTKEIAELAARTIGLDIAGMDAIIRDVSRPLGPQRGCIIEVNAGPSLSPHVEPLIGKPQPVGEAIVDLIYPAGMPSRITTILVVSGRETEQATERIVTELGKSGQRIGVASNGMISNSWPVRRKLTDYRQLIMHPQITATIIEADVASIAEHGLFCEHLDFVLLPKNLISPVSAEQIQPCLDTIKHLIDSSTRVWTIDGPSATATETTNWLPSATFGDSDSCQLSLVIQSICE